MKVFKHIQSTIVSVYFRFREILSPSAIRTGSDIPIIINNFNRISTLMRLIKALEEREYTNIYIIDNNSTYPPLLAYYEETPYTVFRLKENLGYRALWKSKLSDRFCRDYYIYTDSDVVPVEECPENFIDDLWEWLRKHPYARKIGLSLRIDDLPDSYDRKKEVVAWESHFYTRQTKDGLYRAPVDTTFAIYRPRVGLSRSRSVEAYRTPYPYQLYHLPWYQNSADLSEEDQYYVDQCRKETMWSKQSSQG